MEMNFTRKQRKIVNIILVSRRSSRLWADWAAFIAEELAAAPLFLLAGLLSLVKYVYH